LIRAEGVERLQARIRRDLANAQWLAERIAATPPWQVVAPVPLQTICVIHQPPGLTAEELDAHTLAWVERVNASGVALMTPARLGHRWVARISIGTLGTERSHLEQLWSALQKAVAVDFFDTNS
jgi:aromatic-L-amino-acid decarboxylase